MSETSFSSSKVLKTKCGECQLVCAVGPVSEDSGIFYCGRCRPKAAPLHHFEEAAEKVLFPCAFQCEDHLAWGQVLEHEAFCKNRTVVCPFVNCTTNSSLQDLHEHIKTYHKSFYIETPKVHQLQMGNLDLMVRLNCISFEKFVLLFFIKLERKADIFNYYYHVCLLWPQNEKKELESLQIRLEIDMPISDLNITKFINGKNIHNYYDRWNCVNCLYQSCDKKFHQNKCNWIVNNIPVNSKRNVFYNITIYKKEALSGKAPDNLECPVCLDYMTEQIYLCQNGHSICGTCNNKNSDKRCPTCRSTMLSSRNISMEKLVQNMTISCRKKFTGCAFAGPVTTVKVHEKSCKYP